VALVAVAEVRAHVLGPHVGFSEQQLALVVGVEVGTDPLHHRVRLGVVLVARALALDEVRNGVEPEAVHAHVEPVVHRREHGLEHPRIVEVEVGLVAEEAVPVVLLRDRVPRPVRRFRVGEDDARAGVLVRVVAPHVEVALGAALGRAPRRLEPGMLVRGVVDDELGDHAQPAGVRLLHEALHVLARAVGRMHVLVVGDVVAVVEQRARVERHDPDRVHAQVADVVELVGEAAEIPDAVAVRVEERLHVHLVDDRVHVPQRIVGPRRLDERGVRAGRVVAIVHGRAFRPR
jgi:hypothetical protein